MEETRRTFHQELDELRDEVIKMAGLVSENIVRGTEAFLAQDLKAIEVLIGSDDAIDDACHQIEERAYLLLARQQPMATDLRFIVSVLRIINEIERSGDLMLNIGKTARRIYPAEIDPKVRGIIQQMGKYSQKIFMAAIDSYADADTEKARALEEMDDVIDDLQRDLLKELFRVSSEEELEVTVRIALVGRFYERIADHAVNIGERVCYMVTGVFPGTDDAELQL